MIDALVVGAGPAGAVAAWRLARGGARVMLVDREAFPRDKLCGDTLNPGAVDFLSRLGLSGPVASARPLTGMIVTGPGTSIEARYELGQTGRSIRRRVLDDWLVSQAVAAGARFESGLRATGALIDESGGAPVVRGVCITGRHSQAALRLPALITIAADGRTSRIGRAVRLLAFPRAPRRWAFGTYVEGLPHSGSLGEMHIRGRRYIGVAPVTDDLCNVCVVTERSPAGRTPGGVMRAIIEADPALSDRFARVKFEAPISVLGPLAVEARAAGVEGLLLAGDAAGFVDPMTGDGLHLALRGGLMAGEAALDALESGDLAGAPARLADRRRRAFGAKLRFNRLLRSMVNHPAAVDAAGWGAQAAPSLVRWAIRYAGDAA